MPRYLNRPSAPSASQTTTDSKQTLQAIIQKQIAGSDNEDLDDVLWSLDQRGQLTDAQINSNAWCLKDFGLGSHMKEYLGFMRKSEKHNTRIEQPKDTKTTAGPPKHEGRDSEICPPEATTVVGHQFTNFEISGGRNHNGDFFAAGSGWITGRSSHRYDGFKISGGGNHVGNHYGGVNGGVIEGNMTIDQFFNTLPKTERNTDLILAQLKKEHIYRIDELLELTGEELRGIGLALGDLKWLQNALKTIKSR